MSEEKKLAPMSPEMQAVANAVMAFRGVFDPAGNEVIDDAWIGVVESAKTALRDAIYAATPELVAAGFNVFNTGPALKALEDADSYAGALCTHYELDKLRRMLGLEKPVIMTRGGGGR